MMTIHLLIRLLMVLAYLLTIGDVFSTIFAIRKGAHEGNPGVAWVMRWAGPKWIIPRLMMGQGTIYMVLHSSGATNWMGAASFGLQCALLTFVVWSNLRLAGWWK